MTDTALRTLVVGAPFRNGRVLWPEGAVVGASPLGLGLALFVDEPADDYVQAVERGEAEVAVYAAGAAIVLLYRFGDAIAWSDAPVWWGDSGDFPPLAPTLNVALVDAASGIVRALRTSELPAYFRADFDLAVNGAASHGWPGRPEYERMLRALYDRAASDELSRCAITSALLPPPG